MESISQLKQLRIKNEDVNRKLQEAHSFRWEQLIKYSGVIGYVNKEHLKLKRSDTFEDNSHNDFKIYKINTYNSLLKLLKRKIELSQENFISTINKVNVDALINNMQYMQ